MYLVATVTVAIALMVLLILGFLRVARELLSRTIYDLPSIPDDDDLAPIERGSSRGKPGMVEVNAND